MATHLFTSESVSEGHPDKIADQISDAVLDAILEQDPRARVACETYVKTGMVLVGGEVTTSAWVDIEELTRKTVKEIGYTHSDMGFDADSCAVLNAIGKQSPDINQGVDRASLEEQGAGDQGLMFGYASDETDVLMPAPITYSHRLVQKQAEVRKSGKLDWLRPDAKSQITFKYENDKPVGIDAVVLSTQHCDSVSTDTVRDALARCHHTTWREIRRERLHRHAHSAAARPYPPFRPHSDPHPPQQLSQHQKRFFRRARFRPVGVDTNHPFAGHIPPQRRES